MVTCRLGREPGTLMTEPSEPMAAPVVSSNAPVPALTPSAAKAAPASKAALTEDDLAALSKEELLRRLSETQQELERRGFDGPRNGGRENEESKAGPSHLPTSSFARPNPVSTPSSNKTSETHRRESVLFMRLTAKEQEVQECLTQMEELRGTMSSGLRAMLLDPVVSTMFGRMREELHNLKAALEKSQQDNLAWKFTPDSTTGKRLMAKCRSLIAENEELGKAVETGRLAQLEGELGLLRKHRDELQKSQAEVDDLLVDLDEDCEGLQATVLCLQKELEALRSENGQLRERLAAFSPGPAQEEEEAGPSDRSPRTGALEEAEKGKEEAALSEAGFNGLEEEAKEEEERTPSPSDSPRTKRPRLDPDEASPSRTHHPDLNGFHE